MGTGHFSKRTFVRLRVAIANASPFRTPALKEDAQALLFSAKAFTAAMLAYYFSLSIGLPRPYWAIITVYVVSQPSAGASFSRGMYRLAGTIVGAMATVIIVSHFANEPMACSVALACWIGLCFYISLIDRTPRAYAFVLAGYTAGLIGFPSVLDAGTVSNTALVRVQEIVIGILCAVLVHRFVFPKRMTDDVQGKLSSMLCAARRLARDALDGQPRQVTFQDRGQLAMDLLVLQGLAPHLPYDPGLIRFYRKHLKQFNDRITRLLPLAAEMEEKISALRSGIGDSSQELTALVNDAASWIATDDAIGREAAAMQIIDRSTSLQSRITDTAFTLAEMTAAHIAGNLAEMVSLLCDCERLVREVEAGREALDLKRPHSLFGEIGYVYHRDYFMAARAAMGAIIGIVTGSAVWLMLGWQDGGTAVSILAVCCVLFGNVDAPVPNVIKYIAGAVFGVVISLIYGFIILPRVTDFPVLVAVLAPAFLFAGSMQARPPSTMAALGITLTIPILAGLDSSQNADFAKFLSGVIGLFTAIGFAVVSMSLVQTVRVDAAINRLIRLSRRDISRFAFGGGPAEARWTGLMIDRAALLCPRLRLSERTYPGSLVDVLRYLRVGRAVSRLYQANRKIGGHIAHEVDGLLSALASHFAADGLTSADEVTDLAESTDTLIALIAGSSMEGRSQVFSVLIDLRLALSPFVSSDGAQQNDQELGEC